MFTKAVKQEAKLRLAIAGTSGSGKTYTALTIAKFLTDKPVAFVDTEHGSASKYADLFNFDVLDMAPPFHPERFIKLIHEAQAGGYGVIILDSLSHAWNGTGGLLEIVDDFAARSTSKNTFAAWKQGTPIYNKLIDGIIQSDIHIIATMRSKQDYVLESDTNGKMKPVKVGMAPIQRDGFEYEFDIVLSMDADNTAVVTKTRCSALQSGIYRKPGKDLAGIMRDWLTGVKVERKPAPQPEAQPEYSLEWALEVTASDGTRYADRPSDKLQWIANNPKSPAEKAQAARIILAERDRVSRDEQGFDPEDDAKVNDEGAK